MEGVIERLNFLVILSMKGGTATGKLQPIRATIIERGLFMRSNLVARACSGSVFMGVGGKHGMEAMANPLKEAWRGGCNGLEVHVDV